MVLITQDPHTNMWISQSEAYTVMVMVVELQWECHTWSIQILSETTVLRGWNISTF